MSECSRRCARGNDVTNDDAVLFHYLWYEFCRDRCGAGRRFSDSVLLEAWIKLPSVSWIKTLITSGDIYWMAFAGVRTESRPSRFASTLSRILFVSLASFTKPLSTVGANFCRSMIVLWWCHHCFQNSDSYHFYERDFGLSQADNSAVLVA